MEEIATEATSEAVAASAATGSGNEDDAQKILALLTEIGSNQMLSEEFHPWFWEANPAKMMTV